MLYRKHGFAFLFILTIVLLVYSNTFHASWHLDDEFNIIENRPVQMASLSWHEFRKALLSGASSNKVDFYRPLARLSFGLNYYFGKKEVLGYHIFNLSFHIVSAVFLYLFLYHTLCLPSLREKYASHPFLIALWSATVWAVHPIQTQAVTYIVQRMTSLAGMFYIMAMYFFARSQIAQGKPAKIFLLVLCSTCGLLSIGSKENAILLPASLFLFHSLFVNNTAGGWKRNMILLFFFYFLPLLTGLAYLETAHGAITKIFNMYETRTFTMLERLLTEPRALIFYVSLLLYPMPQRFSIDHDLIVSRSLFNPVSTILSIFVIVGVIVAACLQARKRPLLAFSVLFFFLNHALESTILPMELVFEHRNYLPSMFFFVPVAALIVKGLANFSNSRIMRVFMLLSAGLVLVAFAHSSFLRNAVWHDEKSLWEDVLVKYPRSFRAHTNLGRHFVLNGQYERATHEFLQALESRETHRRVEKAIALYNLGYIAHGRGDHQTAFHYYTMALEQDPCCPRANNNLAVLLLETGDGGANDSAALDHLNKAIECNHEEEIESALTNRRTLLIKMGKQDPLATGVK